MGSIFFRIYSSMLLAFLAIALAAYVGLAQVNKYRLTNYLDQVAKGTFVMIAEGVSRHHGEKRTQWLEVVERLTQINLSIRNTEQLHLGMGDLEQLLTQGFLIRPGVSDGLAMIYARLPGESSLFLSAELNSINEPLSRVTALLILNELGRQPKSERAATLHNLRRNFGFTLQKTDRPINRLTDSQQRLLKQGNIVVALENTAATAEPFIYVYAPYGNSGDLLALGPIPFFNWYPKKLLALVGFMALFLVALGSYLCVKPLEKRLNSMAKQVSNLGTNRQFSEVDSDGNDAISNFASHVNQMAQQINSLLDNQRELTLAVSHDLKTPVARLKFRIAELEEELSNYLDPAGFPDCEKIVEGVHRDIKQLESMLGEILSYASLDRQSNYMDQTSFDLGSEAENLAKELSVTHPQLTIHPPVAPFTAFGNHQLICRATENLLSNACRYASSEIHISLKQTSNLYIITVADDGPGISAEQAKKVFEPFYRIDSSRNSKSGGSGLGLAIVEKIANLHHGHARLIPSDKGTTFEIRWPKP